MGAWIEISDAADVKGDTILSLPSWERGLKCYICLWVVAGLEVAPFVGAWIEIQTEIFHFLGRKVAPFVGVRIETLVCRH